LSGNIVLKPTNNENYSNWLAQTFNSLPTSDIVRFPRPVNSMQQEFVHDGYVAWTFLKGEHMKGNYKEKLQASVEFHKFLKNVPNPGFIGTSQDSWATGDLASLEKLDFNYDKAFMDLYDQIKPHLKTMDLPSQLVHGDLTNNFLCDPVLPPAIIDFYLIWAPNGFAEGLMLVDAIAWEDPKQEELEVFKTIKNIEQFAWRGALRRITEQAEYIKWLGKEKELAEQEAKVFQKVIDHLSAHFS
jgi:hypothetical protein